MTTDEKLPEMFPGLFDAINEIVAREATTALQGMTRIQFPGKPPLPFNVSAAEVDDRKGLVVGYGLNKFRLPEIQSEVSALVEDRFGIRIVPEVMDRLVFSDDGVGGIKQRLQLIMLQTHSANVKPRL